MDNKRRKRIREVLKLLRESEPDWSHIEAELEDIRFEEEERHESMPESMEDSETYRIQEESIDLLIEALDNIDPEDMDSSKFVIEVLEQIDGI